jgi:superfamily II DNA or RNA helicase
MFTLSNLTIKNDAHLKVFTIVKMSSVPSRVLSTKGYSIAKADLTPAQVAFIKKDLLVSPVGPAAYVAAIPPFKLYLESAERYYLPTAWATNQFGPALADVRATGDPLPAALKFGGTLRQHQVDALSSFRGAEQNGIICLPCGYGKTFTGIAAALEIGKCFLIVVHKEFLADQWSNELRALVPGIRIGRIQGEKCDVGPEFDVSIAMIQTICSRTFLAGTFNHFGFAIFDEVHHLGAEHFSQTLQRIHCRKMLGLTATPKRLDGLSKVFTWFLGSIVYQISRRPKDETVLVECLRYTSADDAYTDVKSDWAGKPIRACMVNNIANFLPRTIAMIEWIAPCLSETGRRLLVLSDRREHLKEFETGFKARGVVSIGYYVGGMKQKDLDISATRTVILGTFAMASEGMNIPTLNAILLATPKSNIEQSIGRILRLKPEERTVQPRIYDVLDTAFVECFGQWSKRRKFYKECGYVIKFADEDKNSEESKSEDEVDPNACLITDD